MQIEGLTKNRRNSIANSLRVRLFCIKPSRWFSVNYGASFAAAPVFQDGWQPVDNNVTEGQDHTFYCKADAEPAADIQWMINGEPIDRK